MISSSRAGANRTEDSRARISGFQSGMFLSSDAADGFDKRRPRLPLPGQYLAAFRGEAIDTPAPLACFFHPYALDPGSLLQAVEQGIERVDMKGQLSVGSRPDQLAEVISVPRLRFEQRQDEQLRGTLLQLTIECLGVDICHNKILGRQTLDVNREDSVDCRSSIVDCGLI